MKKARPSDSDRPEPASPNGDNPHTLHLWQFQAVRDVGMIAIVVGVILLGFWLRSVTVPLLIALTLAYLFEPIVLKLTNRFDISRTAVVSGLVAIVGLLFAACIVGLVITVVQTVDLIRTLPERTEQLIELVDENVPESISQPVVESLAQVFAPSQPDTGSTESAQNPPSDQAPVDDPPVQPEAQTTDDDTLANEQAQSPESTADDLAEHMATWLRNNLGSVFRATVATTGGFIAVVTGVLGSVVYVAFLMFLIPFYFFAFSTGWPHLRDYVTEVFPPSHAPTTYRLLEKMDTAVSGFVRGRVVISAIMGVMLATGWWIVGVPYWLLLGLLTGLFSAVPYLGGIGVPLAIGLLWIGQADMPSDQQMAWWGIILWPSLVFIVVQLIEGYILTPVIAGKATNLDPVSILVAVLAGGVVAGVYGMILAIPAAACIKILTTDVLVPRVKEWARGEARDFIPLDND